MEHSCFGDARGIVLPEAYTSATARCIEVIFQKLTHYSNYFRYYAFRLISKKSYLFYYSVWSVRASSVHKNLFVILMIQKIEHVTGASTVTTGVLTFIWQMTTQILNAKNYQKLWQTLKTDTNLHQ